MTQEKSLSFDQKGAEMRRVTRTSVVVALVLVAIKSFAWVYTGSVALLGSLLDSFLDAFASGVTLLAITHAITPADREHRFGHGKAEAIAGLLQAAIISVSALYLFVQSIQRFITPVTPTNSSAGIIVVVISIALTAWLVRYQRRVVERTGSLAVSSDSLHYVGDVMMNAGILVSLMLVEFGVGAYADAVMGVIIAGILGKSVWSIASNAFDMLMDREMADEERARIKEVVLAHPEVQGLHDLRTRTSGLISFIQFHVELDPTLSLMRAHQISDAVQGNLSRAFPDADIIIHTDPGYDGPGPEAKDKKTAEDMI
ncbi:cation diffusion facilitator family transporter [Govanella unica]|uniref:Protein p34 n=1 Tax=Govanella unica TaxID=2975056 RepID=A0A9X3TYF1_9PROT|nr:cation diffusion facilitator family transporter [Govania unica]MDA5194039.1 cation diffusion facilitator family transporter [Govania unica]